MVSGMSRLTGSHEKSSAAHRPLRMAAAEAIVIAVAFAGCSSSNSNAPVPGSCSINTIVDDGCTQCIKQSCCAQVTVCAADADAGCTNAVTQCTGPSVCTTLSCVQSCVQRSGNAGAEAYVTCIQNGCTTACGK